MIDEKCPACGAEPERPCRTIIDGVDTGWTHDLRVLAPILRDIQRAHSEATR